MLPTILYAKATPNLTDTATVSVADGSGAPDSTGNPVDIELDNTMAVGGVQFTLTFDDSLLSTDCDVTTTTPRSSHMDMACNDWADSIKVLIFSMTGDSILPGTGPIVKVLFDVSGTAVIGDSTLLHLKDVFLSNSLANPIPVITEDGWFYFVEPGVVEDETRVISIPPKIYALLQNYPNPCYSETEVAYQLPKSSKVTLNIYNSTGQLVKTLVDEDQQPGYHKVQWNGKDKHGKLLASGIYFYRMEADEFTSTKKLVRLK